MPQYIDSYYLINYRKLEIVNDFFLKYLPACAEELATDYPFPEFSDNPESIFYSSNELLKQLQENPDYEYTVYYQNNDKLSEIKQITLQYTDDRKLIFGISIIGNDPSSEKSIELFKQIKQYLGSDIACITIEEAPPINSDEFKMFCSERYVPDVHNI